MPFETLYTLLNISAADTVIQIIFFPKGFAITFKWNILEQMY